MKTVKHNNLEFFLFLNLIFLSIATFESTNITHPIATLTSCSREKKMDSGKKDSEPKLSQKNQLVNFKKLCSKDSLKVCNTEILELFFEEKGKVEFLRQSLWNRENSICSMLYRN